MKMRKQRAWGAVMVVISGIILAIALGGVTVEERDATAVLLTLPLGLYLLFTDSLVMDNFSDSDEAVPEAEWSPINETTHN